MSKLVRCGWADQDPLLTDYHDKEWGRATHDDRRHFEFLVLEAAQAGLSWLTVLKKRPGYRKAFSQFAVATVAGFGAKEEKMLLANKEIIRNRLKIKAAINNAQRFLEIQQEFGSFDNYCWQFTGGKPIVNRFRELSQVPAHSPESAAFSKDLKQRGFKFVGPTVIYSHMQAVGMVNDHLETCFCFEECLSAG